MADQIVVRGYFSATEPGFVRSSGGGTTTFLRADGVWATPTGSGSPLTDGDKGDITVASGGTSWTIDNGAVSTAKLGGDITTAGKALLDDPDATAQRATLGLGSSATQPSSAFEAAGAVATHAAVTSGVHGISSYGASLVDDANATAARNTLGLGTAATANAGDFDAAGDAAAVGATAASNLATHAGLTVGAHGMTALGAALVASPDSEAARTELDLADIAASGDGADMIDGSTPLAKLVDIVAARLLGRASGAGTGAPTALTGTQATAILDLFTSSLQGLVPASGGGTTTFLRADGTFALPVNTSGGDFGDAYDGNATDPASPLTSHVSYDTLTLSNGYSLDTGGYILRARAIVVPSGSATIHRNGNAGNSATNNSGANATGGASVTGGYFGTAGASGGNGGGNAGNSSSSCPRGYVAGTAAAVTGPSAGNNGGPGNDGGAIGRGASGGAGGAAAAGTGGTSGAGGTVANYTQTQGDIHNKITAIDGLPARGSSTTFTCGSGGGGGGAGNTNAGAGGGGSGGGYCVVVAGSITGTLNVQARGGSGGNGATGTTGNNCGGGGGGGGGGGVVVVVIGAGSFPTTNVSGGAPGAGGTGFGTGKNGGDGGRGGGGMEILLRGT